jgi:hypothetical protein
VFASFGGVISLMLGPAIYQHEDAPAIRLILVPNKAQDFFTR